MYQKSNFFYKFIFIVSNETKDNNRVYKKKYFSIIFGSFGWETHPGLRYKYKKVKFCMQIFFRKIYILAQMQICSQKRY